MTSWPRGSEWRLWDLHLHSPGTKLSDGFLTADGDLWDEYCRRLVESDVAVFGIADYFSVDGFLKTRAELTKRYPDCTKLLIPNIELRSTDVVNRAQEEVHIHLLFNPDLPDLAALLRKFLAHLKTSKSDGPGRTVAAAELTERSDFERATVSRDNVHAALVEVFGRDADFTERVLIVSSANNDGMRPERGRKRKELISDEIDKFSDCFWGHRGNVEYFLNPERLEDPGAEARRKPVLSGSDAHSLADMDARLGRVEHRSDGSRFEPTWVKADPTFEGLRQILFEPENRVYIGEEPPVRRRVRENKTRYIRTLEISTADGTPRDRDVWFRDITIPLNPELVAIIGNKGSGKSAVTDVVGLIGNSHNQHVRQAGTSRTEELFSFLNSNKFLKAGLASSFEGRVVWEEGETPPKLLDARVNLESPERVEYLPQKYLERLCGDLSDDEFRTTLNVVIFRYIPQKDRYDQEDLKSLIEYRTRQASEDLAKARDELSDFVEAVVGLEKKLTPQARGDLEARLLLREEELAAHDSERPAKVRPPAEADSDPSATRALEEVQGRLDSLAREVTQLEEKQSAGTRRAEDIRQLRQAIARDTGTLLGHRKRFGELFGETDLSFEQVIKIDVDYSGIDTELRELNGRLDELGMRLAPPPKGPADAEESEGVQDPDRVPSLLVRLAQLEATREALTAKLAKPARDHAKYLADLAAWQERRVGIAGSEESPVPGTRAWLQRELSRMDLDYPEALKGAWKQVKEKAGEIFDLKVQLSKFYDEIKAAIDSEIARCREELGEYAMSVDVGLHLRASFNEEFLARINQSAMGTFRTIEEGMERLQEVLDQVPHWNDRSAVFAALGELVERLHVDKRPGSAEGPRSPFKQMGSKHSLEELYEFLYGFEYLEPKYDLRVDGKDLSELSPGERGGLLLIFYLMLDRRDIPLVIDQPEDNLDNRSVYEVLVRFIKQAKARRQIILVTHNPNLAVVADAEQVIHVGLDKADGRNAFRFTSGSIEALPINLALLDILEGTLPAFDNRRLKYRAQESAPRV